MKFMGQLFVTCACLLRDYLGCSQALSSYSYPVELFTTVLLVVISLGLGVGLLIYGVRGTRESQARDGRTYKRGRL
jgi:hypothetical protein